MVVANPKKIFFVFGFFIALAFSDQAQAKIQKCLKFSQTGSESGPPSQRKNIKECCSDLKKIEVKETCGKGLGGAFKFVCAECGDQKCDPQFENSCNCPSDCD